MIRRLAQMAFLLAASAALLPRQVPPTPASESFPGWPESFEGHTLVETPLTESEALFDARFPGKIGRFRAGGETVEPLPIERREDGDWSAFTARKEGEGLVVREQVRAADGMTFPDVEGGFWQALAGRTSGPWLVISVASRGRP